jgi:MFS family permease
MKKLWNKDFILLLQASAVSTIGDLMYSVAIGYWVYEQTGSNSLMGIMSSISMFVTMFLSPFSGSIVDKLNRKRVLVIGDLFQGIIMLTIGTLAFLGKLEVPGVLIAAFLCALGGVFYSPASNTVLIDIIPRDDMVRGQSLFSGVSSTINLVGSAFSGLMVAFFGVPLIVVLNGLSNIYSAISELFISVPKGAQQGEKVTVKSVIGDTMLAFKTMFSDPCLRVFAPCALLINFLSAGAFTIMLPFVMEKGFSVEEYGYFMSIITIGSLACILLLGIVKFSPKVRFWMMAIGFSLSVVFMVITYMSSSFLPMCVTIFIASFLNCAGNSIFNASMVLALPEENRGAILGAFSSACVGGSALSALTYGFLCDIFPMQTVFVAGSLLSLAPMLFMSFNRKSRDFIINH